MFGGGANGAGCSGRSSRLPQVVARCGPASARPIPSRMLESWKVLRARRAETQRIRGARRAIWAAVSPPRSRLGWILMTHWQNSHVTLPSSWISVVLDRPQLRQCQFRTTVFMDARFLAEGRRRTRTKGGRDRRGDRKKRVYHALAASDATPRTGVGSKKPVFPALFAPSRRRDLGRLGRRRNGLKRRRMHGGRGSLDPQHETRRSSKSGNRGRVRSGRRGLRGLPLRRVVGAMLPRAGKPDRAENDHRQGPTDALHRSPSVADNFCRSELEIDDRLWRARIRHLPQVIEV
jgi:hypothetical protein